MKWLMINAYFPPEIGSASFLFFELGKKLVEKGHEVVVLTNFPRYNIDKKQLPKKYRRRLLLKETIDRLTVVRVKTFNFPRYIPFLRGMDHLVMAFMFLLGSIFIRGNKLDRILVYSPPLPLGLTAFVISKLRKIPFILNVQDLFPQSAIDLGVLKNKFLIRWLEGLERFIYKKADIITVHSDGNRKHVLDKGARENRIVVLPNWIDTDSIVPGERHNEFREEFELGDKFIVSFAGVIGYSQDIDTVIETARLLKDKDILILIVGDGVEKPRLEEKVKSLALQNVKFIPMQPKEKYAKLLAASDVCLVNLHKEVKTPVVPSKLLSIMSAERAVAASMPLSGDAPKIIEESGCGICVDAGDARGLAESIEKMHDDYTFRNACAKKGRKYAEDNFSLAYCVTLYENIFELIKK